MKTTWILVVGSIAFALGLGSPAADAQKMYLSASGGIVRANLDGAGVEVLVAGLLGAKGIALDVPGGMMYWTDAGAEKIQRANLQIPPGETPDNRTDIEDLVTAVRASVIALDPAGGKMYWTTSPPYKVQRANLDGSAVEDLVTTGLGTPTGIALHLPGAKVYWADTDKIQRANLDGSNVEDLVVPTGDDAPYSLALDVEGGKMYWMSAGIDFQLNPKIRRASLDGSGVEVLVDPAGYGIGIAVDAPEGKVYWTHIVGGLIERANLDGSELATVLDTGSLEVKGIALDLRPTDIPTLSQWGLITMIALLLGAGAIIIRRRVAPQSDPPDSGRFAGERL